MFKRLGELKLRTEIGYWINRNGARIRKGATFFENTIEFSGQACPRNSKYNIKLGQMRWI
jgi:hypothetical protein